MMTQKCIFVFFVCSSFVFYLSTCQVTRAYELALSTESDYIDLKHLPAVLHNDNVYLTVVYKCSSLKENHSDQRRLISLAILIERTLYRSNFAVFRRHWYCQPSVHVQIRYIHVRLHRSLAFATDIESNLQSWPIEQGRLILTMFDSERAIVRKVEYDVRFLPIHQRPSIRSKRWTPLINDPSKSICPREPEMVRVVDYPLVLTGGGYGKHIVLPSYRDYNLRLEQKMRLMRPKFSIIFWLYIDEYCPKGIFPTSHCAIFQHVTFNDSHLTPELFLNQNGQIIVNMYGYAYDQVGTEARVIASVPKRDWCRVAFVANESSWNIFVNCLRTWNEPIKAVHISPIFYYFADEFGTFVIGGSDVTVSFRGFISQMDIYRRVALTYEQLPNKLDPSIIPFLPPLSHESSICAHHLVLFNECREQFDQFIQRIHQKSFCSALPARLMQPRSQQCLLVRTWKQQLASSPSSIDVRYRIFRTLRRQSVNSTMVIADKLFDAITKLLQSDDLKSACIRIVAWSQQAVCYGNPSAYSLLATLHQFGLCGLVPNATRALELLLAGALRSDRASLLALGHRHFYGLDGVPQDYDAAYVYYRQMADTAKHELYNPKEGEAAMELVRLNDDKLINELTFDKSDSFYWLKQQAFRGVASAQHHLGSILYAGRNGLTRNVQAAVEYFRLGAAQNDASSHFGYGLALLKGQGTKQNVTEGVRHIEKAVKSGFLGAQVALGYHAYEIEKNYTKAAQHWTECFQRTRDANCAHNLGVMLTAGRYPPQYIKDHVRAWDYFSYAAQHQQIDSKIVVAQYNARGGHPMVPKNSWLSAVWSRSVADDSSAVGTLVRRALEAYRDRRWESSFLYYLQAALTGAELGYFNAGYLCKELKINFLTSIDCIEQLLDVSVMMRDNDAMSSSYALLTVAQHAQLNRKNLTRAMQLYVQLFRHGDPRGLFNLAQMEEELDQNDSIPLKVWSEIGIQFDNNIATNRYRRLQIVYEYCRTLKIDKGAEAYVPCTLAYLRISTMIYLGERFSIIVTLILLVLSTLLIVGRM